MVVARSLPHEIVSESVLNIAFSPRALEILFPHGSVDSVETALPVYKFKGSSPPSRSNRSLIVCFESCRQVLCEADIELVVPKGPQNVNVAIFFHTLISRGECPTVPARSGCRSRSPADGWQS